MITPRSAPTGRANGSAQNDPNAIVRSARSSRSVSVWKLNLFTRVATESRALLTLPKDAWNGPEANETIRWIVRDVQRVVIAYGRFDHLRAAVDRRALEVRSILRAEARCPVGTLGRNKDGSPPHPLMLPYSTRFVEMPV
jgi:hypothetical protein